MKRILSCLATVVAIVMVAASASAGEIKIIDYNVWHGIDGKGTVRMGEYEPAAVREKRFNLLVAGLKEMNPDIVGIQEANRVRSYSKRLARAIDREAVWKVGNSGIKLFGLGLPVNFSEGLAILAKKEYKNELLGSKRLSGGGIQREYFSSHLAEVRYAIAARVYIENKPLIVFNVHTHFGLIPDETTRGKIDGMIARGELPYESKAALLKEIDEGHRWTESDILALLAFVKETVRKHNHPYIIMGDFNTTLKSEALRKLVAGLGLVDPWAVRNPGKAGYTWDPTVNPNTKHDGSPYMADGKTPKSGIDALEAEFDRTTPRRIDFILLSKHFRPESIKSARLIFNEPVDGVFVSDHIGVEVVLDGMP
jgi:endonuclease/exonuclease/phosphatase family metal-dependent hydrolase